MRQHSLSQVHIAKEVSIHQRMEYFDVFYVLELEMRVYACIEHNNINLLILVDDLLNQLPTSLFLYKYFANYCSVMSPWNVTTSEFPLFMHNNLV